MKKIILILITFIHVCALGNMAEPIVRGTLGGRPFTSQYVDVRHENLKITIDKEFNYAQFEIEYHIESSKDGIQIPLMFYASEYFDSFKIFIDGKEISIKEIPYELRSRTSTIFNDFSYFFGDSESIDQIQIKDSPTTAFGITYNNLMYFETDITKGKHVISVSYRATKWIDKWDWINEYSFRYALSPANYWKSFGTLDLTVDASAFDKPVQINVGKPINTIGVWHFNNIPVDVLKISYDPEVSLTAERLIAIGPSGLALMLGFVLLILHVWSTYIFRKRNPEKKYSKVVIAGSIFLPLIFLYSWANFYSLIDNVIGEHASREHGYIFFVYGLYLFMPIYWAIIWGIDSILKKRLQELKKEIT